MLGDADDNLNINNHLPGTLSVIKIIHGEANKDIKMQMEEQSLCQALGSCPGQCQGLALHQDHQPCPGIPRVKKKSLGFGGERGSQHCTGRNQKPRCGSSHSAFPCSYTSHHSVAMAQITDNFSINQTITWCCEDASVLCWREVSLSVPCRQKRCGVAVFLACPFTLFLEDLGLSTGPPHS